MANFAFYIEFTLFEGESMKKNIKRLLISLIMIIVLGLLGCNLRDKGDNQDNSDSAGTFVPEQNLNVTVEFVVTDPLLYEQYQAQGLPEVIERIAPSVVGITVSTDNSTASGTGIVVANNEAEELTFIVTSHSLIAGAKNVTVTDFSTGKEYSASPVGTDPQTDICLIKISAFLQKSIIYAESSTLKTGTGILSLSNVMGSQKIFASTGIIGATDFVMSAGEGKSNSLTLANLLWTNNSMGGGIFTQEGGYLVGMICTGSTPNMPAYVINADTIKEVCEKILETGVVEGRYKLGISVADNKSGWGITESVSIIQLAPDGCMYADGAGLKEGDIIESFVYDGTTYQINKTEDLYGYLYGFDFDIGDRVVFNIERTGTRTQIEITIKQYNYFDYQ